MLRLPGLSCYRNSSGYQRLSRSFVFLGSRVECVFLRQVPLKPDYFLYRLVLAAFIVFANFGFGTTSAAADDLAELREQLQRQQEQLEEQARKQEAQDRRIGELEATNRQLRRSVEAAGPEPDAQDDSADLEIEAASLGGEVRDSIGDSNASSIREGEFPGSILIKRREFPVSLGISGFLKTVAYSDTNYEKDDPLFFPALLGVGRDDDDGEFGISAELSRLIFDARANTGLGDLRGYIEWEFRDDFNLRHAYIGWTGEHGELLVGQYWSAFMDLAAIPEGVTEAAVSGAILARQEQIRYTKLLGEKFLVTVSVEDPTSNDILTNVTPQTNSPDFVSTVRWNAMPNMHLQAGGLYRRIEVDGDALVDNSTSGWGAHLSGSWRITAADRVLGGASFGDGIGRYLLGLGPFSGAFIDPDSLELESQKARGFYGSYARTWADTWRTNVSYGQARADTAGLSLADNFKSSKYLGANIFYEITPYLTVGLEYNWGERKNIDGSDIDNRRVMLGLQFL